MYGEIQRYICVSGERVAPAALAPVKQPRLHTDQRPSGPPLYRMRCPFKILNF